MAKKKSQYPQPKFANKKDNSLEENDSFNNDKIAPKIDKNHDLIFKETIEALKKNKDFFKKLIDEANEQMSRTIFENTPK